MAGAWDAGVTRQGEDITMGGERDRTRPAGGASEQGLLLVVGVIVLVGMVALVAISGG